MDSEGLGLAVTQFAERVREVAATIPLHVVVISFACVALWLLAILIFQAFRGRREKVDKHRSNAPGVADLLNWAAVVDDGVILNKNGSFMAAWLYRGGDNASATKSDRNGVSHWIIAAVNTLGSGWMFHIDAIRRPCPAYSERGFSHFPDAVSMAIDEERRNFFESQDTLYEGAFVLVATYFPPVIAQTKFVEMMFDDPDGTKEDAGGRGAKLLEKFKRDVNNLESRLTTVFHMERLRGQAVETEDGAHQTYDDFLRWLHYCLTGINQPILLPDNPFYIDNLVGGQDFVTGLVPIIGDKHIMVVAIENFPFESLPGMLNSLAELPVEYRWNTRFIFLDAHEAISRIEKFRRKWQQKVRGIFDQVMRTNKGAINQDALLMVNDTESALLEVNSGAAAFGYYSSNIVLMGEDRDAVQASAQYVQRATASLGFPSRIEEVNAVDAFLGTLPGHGVENVRRSMMNTRNLADLMPSSSIWTGEDKAPCEFYPPLSPALMHCVTTGYSPFRLNLHVRDLGHTIIFGPTGAGKSVLLATLASQFLRYEGMTVFAFDKGMSMYALAKAVGGQHYNVGGDSYFDDSGNEHSNLAFCPLQYLETKQDRAWAVEWIESLCTLNNLVVTAEHRKEITAAIENMAKEKMKTMLEFQLTVQTNEIKAAVEMYTSKGMMGYMLDAERDELDLSANGGLTVFEIEELMAMGDAKYNLPVLLYLFRRVAKSLKGQPAAIFLDEAWLMLAHAVFRDKIREWFKVLRKANCALILATQSLSDAVGSGILDVIRESTATKIFLPNVHAKGADTADVYRSMGLNPQQISIISTAIPKRQYYYTSENGNRLFELALGPLALSLVAVSDKDSVATIQKLETSFGDGWLPEWLKLRGLPPDMVQSLLPEGHKFKKGLEHEYAYEAV